MRKALVVGIDHYEHIGSLTGCVNDAYAMMQLLDRNADSTINFGQPKLIVGTGPADIVERVELKEAVRELFADDSDVALFYFAGHGYVEATGGYLCAGDCKNGDDGLAVSDIMTFANKSPARNKIIILDSCHSGVIGEHPLNEQITEIAEGVTILTASTKKQYANEVNGGGVFTGLLLDALNGAASNLVGQISPGAVYAHIDQSLGNWSQRPIFKTNVKRFVSLREVQPPFPLTDLQRIAELFPAPGFEFKLDPSFEPEREDGAETKPGYVAPDPKNNAIFAILQKFNRVNLVVPIDAPHMWHAAMGSKSCRLTATGEHYRGLVQQGLI